MSKEAECTPTCIKTRGRTPVEPVVETEVLLKKGAANETEEAVRRLQTRTPSQSVVHHSDRDGQYAGKSFRQMLRGASMKQSIESSQQLR